MQVKINPNVEFELEGDRKVVLDAYELAQFHDQVWEAKCIKDHEGKPKLAADGRPSIEFGAIIAEMGPYLKLKFPDLELKPSELIGIFNSAPGAWETVKKNWQRPTGGSPTSPVSTDPRYSD